MCINHIFQFGNTPDTKRLLLLWAEYINQRDEEENNGCSLFEWDVKS